MRALYLNNKCREDRIRTCDHMTPSHVRYRAALLPEEFAGGQIYYKLIFLKICRLPTKAWQISIAGIQNGSHFS